MAVLRDLIAICGQHGVEPSCCRAVATEVFRKAANGEEFLRNVQAQLGLEVEVVTQDPERLRERGTLGVA